MTFLLFSAFDQTSKAWLQGESRVETYSAARAALDYMSRELAQAMVNSNSLQFFGLTNAVAFIAPADDRLGDPVDLAEVVYRLTNTAAPYTLVRRTSVYSNSTTAADCWDYGRNQPCAGGLNALAWDFYKANTPNWMETSQSNRTAALAENIMSLTFTYVATNNYPYSYWNSTNTASIWNNEFPNIMPPVNTVDINNPPDSNSGGELYMTNHAPAGVYITIGAIDSRTAIKLASLGTTSGSAWNTITNQAEKFFTTFVEIPNR